MKSMDVKRKAHIIFDVRWRRYYTVYYYVKHLFLQIINKTNILGGCGILDGNAYVHFYYNKILP